MGKRAKQTFAYIFKWGRNIFFQKDKNNLDSLYFLKNSFLQVLDANFVVNLEFDKMGDKNLYSPISSNLKMILNYYLKVELLLF